MHVMSTIGILPSWIREEVCYAKEAAWAGYFFSEYEIGPLLAPKLEQFGASIQASLTKEFGHSFGSRVVENTLSKVYRELNIHSTEEGWSNVLFTGHNLFVINGEEISILDCQGKKLGSMVGGLMNIWQFGKRKASIPEIVLEMNIDNSFPKKAWLESFSIPIDFLRSRPSLEFPIRGRTSHNSLNIEWVHERCSFALQKMSEKGNATAVTKTTKKRKLI